MKAKRRHELQHNTLDAELEKIIKFFRKHGWTIITCILAVVIAWMLFAMWQSSRAEDRADIVRRFEQAHAHVRSGGAEDPEKVLAELDDLIDQTKVPRISVLAAMDAGDIVASQVRQAGEKLAAARVTGAAASVIGELNKTFEAQTARARDYYEKAREGMPDEQIIVARAQVGLAALAETGAGMLAGEQRTKALRKALDQYRAAAALSGAAGSPVAALAESAVRRLTDSEGNLKASYTSPVRMATTAPAPPPPPATQPATQPATRPATRPASRPAKTP